MTCLLWMMHIMLWIELTPVIGEMTPVIREMAPIMTPLVTPVKSDACTGYFAHHVSKITPVWQVDDSRCSVLSSDWFILLTPGTFLYFDASFPGGNFHTGHFNCHYNRGCTWLNITWNIEWKSVWTMCWNIWICVSYDYSQCLDRDTEHPFLEPEHPINIYVDAYFVLEYRRMFRWQ